jgi:hypothetical protein
MLARVVRRRGVAGGGLVAGAAGATQPCSAFCIETVAGNGTAGSSDGLAVSAELNVPVGVAEDAAGTLYIADAGNDEIRKVVMPTADHQDVISTIAGTGAAGFGGDGGSANASVLDDPTGIAVDNDGNVFFADTGNNRVREISAAGNISTIAGNGRCSFTLTNGVPAVQASLCAPTGIALDQGVTSSSRTQATTWSERSRARAR